MADPLFLGARVLIVEAQIKGVVTERTECLDGTVNWTVEYWHEGDRCSLKCEPRELALLEPNPINGL